MALRFQDWFTDLLGFQNAVQFGAQQDQPQIYHKDLVECSTFLAPVPQEFDKVPLVVVQDNLAVLPTDWTSSGIRRPWFAIESHTSMLDCAVKFQDASFIAFDPDFLDIIGEEAKLYAIYQFSGSDAGRVHEAPAYIPALNELVFADTSVVGWLWALEVDTGQMRKINTRPSLENVNGATVRGDRLFLTTNGGRAPGIWNCSVPTGQLSTDRGTDTSTESVAERESIGCVPLVNNFRFRHFNSPNDLIFTSQGNILFTDPTYGWTQAWPGVGPPELPTITYHFNTKTRALVALDDQIQQPNGLVLSTDQKTLFIADSNSTSDRPINTWEDSVRSVYAFDWDEESLTLQNKRLVHVVESGWPDGLRLLKTAVKGESRELVLVALMGGVDVVDVSKGGAGVLLGKFNVGHDTIFNLERAGTNTWLFTGRKAVYKLEIAVT